MLENELLPFVLIGFLLLKPNRDRYRTWQSLSVGDGCCEGEKCGGVPPS
jgi:hypothetical protein